MSTISKFAGRVVCTKAQFDALAEKDPNKEYLVTDDDTYGGGKYYIHDVSISDNRTPTLQPSVFFKYISKDNTKFSIDKLNFKICFDVTTSTSDLPPKHYKVDSMIVGGNDLNITYYPTYPYSAAEQTTITISIADIDIRDNVVEL